MGRVWRSGSGSEPWSFCSCSGFRLLGVYVQDHLFRLSEQISEADCPRHRRRLGLAVAFVCPAEVKRIVRGLVRRRRCFWLRLSDLTAQSLIPAIKLQSEKFVKLENVALASVSLSSCPGGGSEGSLPGSSLNEDRS